jgi:hypothetical protein
MQVYLLGVDYAQTFITAEAPRPFREDDVQSPCLSPSKALTNVTGPALFLAIARKNA